MKNKSLEEIYIFYGLMAIFAFSIGFIVYDLLLKSDMMELTLHLDGVYQVEHTSAWMIFRNNIFFFILVSVTPIFNFVMMVTQVAQLGILCRTCQVMEYSTQFHLFYRHTIFELIALALSVRISYLLFYMGKRYLKDKQMESTENYKKTIRKIVWLYLGIILLTGIGAMLEGNVNVSI